MSIELEQDGFRTLYASGGGTYEIHGRITLTPVDDGGGEPSRWPDATNTGVRVPTTLITSARPGDEFNATRYTVRTAGAVFEGVEFQRLVEVRAAGVRFIDCRFSGLDAMPPASTALLSVRDDRPATGPVPSATLEHCTLRPRKTGVLHDAIRGSNITVRRCDISGVVDGVHIFGSTQVADPWAGNVVVKDCFFHDFIVVPDPGRPSGLSHNDAIQIVGGSDIIIRGNVLGSARKASIMIVPTRNNTRNILIEENLVGVSEAAINANDDRNPSGAIAGLIIRGNVFERQPIAAIITRRTRETAVFIDNEWSDGSQPPPVVRPG